jgi:hypothetical protein
VSDSDVAKRTDEPTIHGQPAAEPAPMLIREWQRSGRHCLFVETADGRLVGVLNVNTGVATLAGETYRPAFEAAIADWFAAALDASAPESAAPALAPVTPAPAVADEAADPTPARRSGGRGPRHRKAPALRMPRANRVATPESGTEPEPRVPGPRHRSTGARAAR